MIRIGISDSQLKRSGNLKARRVQNWVIYGWGFVRRALVGIANEHAHCIVKAVICMDVKQIIECHRSEHVGQMAVRSCRK